MSLTFSVNHCASANWYLFNGSTHLYHESQRVCTTVFHLIAHQILLKWLTAKYKTRVCERKGLDSQGRAKRQSVVKLMWQTWPPSWENSSRLEMKTGFLSPRSSAGNVGSKSLHTRACTDMIYMRFSLHLLCSTGCQSPLCILESLQGTDSESKELF